MSAEEPAAADAATTQQPTTEEAADGEKPKDNRSFEDRIAALKKPTPVPQPDEEKVNRHLSSLNAEIEKCDRRLVSVSQLSLCRPSSWISPH